jgi:hypothetical protein
MAPWDQISAAEGTPRPLSYPRGRWGGFIVVLRNQFREGLGEFVAESQPQQPYASSARRSYYLTTFIVNDGSRLLGNKTWVTDVLPTVTHVSRNNDLLYNR